MRQFIALILFLSLTATATAATGQTFIYQVNGQDYEGYFISPKKDAPLVLLIHDWDGLTEYERKRANMLADKGYAVMAADLFGAGVRPTEVKDKKQHTGELYQDRVKMRALLTGALEAAKSKGGDISNATAMGYCFGGAAVLELARSGTDMKGFVTFHGGLKTPEGQNYANTKGKLLILHGTTDAHITMEHFAELAAELDASKVQHEIYMSSFASFMQDF